MGKYGITVECEFDDDETAKDAGHIIASVLAYIASNIEVDVEKDYMGLIYCSHNDEGIMAGGVEKTPG